jgi:exportin-2 (importin alpha re-exporter)
MFKRYRQAYKSDELYKELKYVLDAFVAPAAGVALGGES